MLSEHELTELRMVAQSLLPDRATITRITLESDGHLGQTETETVIASNIPCRVIELGEGRGNRDVAIGGQLTTTGDYTLRLPYGVDVNENDVIEVTVSHRVRTFNVSRVIERSFATLTTLVCSEVR